MPLHENELRAIHAQACAAVLKSDRTLSPVDEAFWPRYIQAVLEARRANAKPFCYAYIYPSPGGPVWRTDTGGREINGSYAIGHRALFEDPPIAADMTPAVRDVLAERRRVIDHEGFTPEHDDGYHAGTLAYAASAYALNAADTLSRYTQLPTLHLSPDGALVVPGTGGSRKVPIMWPVDWAPEFWKPKTPRADLVRAAQLLIAEIERMDRDPGDESGHHHTRGGDL